MNIIEFQKLLKSNLPVKSYRDEVPKAAKYPAISFRHQVNSAARLMNGEESGRSSTWNVVLQSKNDEDADMLVKAIKKIHNITNDYYQRVFVTIGTTVPKATDETVISTTVTIQTFDWS